MHGFTTYYYAKGPGNSAFNVINARGFSYDPGGGAVSFMADFQLPYAPLLGGYSMNLLFSTFTRASFDADAIADFGSTFRLTDVTLADGSSVANAVTFDSGFRVAAVPEPSAVVMLAIGGVAMLGRGRARRAGPDGAESV
ncbi:PEP-CTERM sorting domain-containing protein [Paludisphaera soli]|uniref:PEP-CTERM sorting domain-containing protein n=1 Tax=Paludisphaera soli TaxID=2712865 RepID=UPI0013EB504D|nr:PEP-CTERM sorting domain-containing protein [Paludisphaera soli]